MSVIPTEVLERALPDKYRKNLNKELIENINQALTDPDIQDTLRDNFLSYVDVLNDGRFKITDYLNAVRYCTQKLMGNSNIDAYIKTFPDRYQDQLQRGLSNKDIQSIITVYNKSKLVTSIMEQSLVPSWILNQHLHQEAINTQAELMRTAQSEKVRSDSANSLLIHLKPPEVTKVELDVGMKDNDQLAQLRETTLMLAAQQKKLIEGGAMTAKAIAEQKVIREVKYDDADK